MALQNDTSRIQYNGNNSTTNSYAIPFVFFENSHIKCVVTTSAGVDTELTLGSTFNVTGAGNANGGSLTTTTAVPNTSKVTIFRNVPATQTTSYQEGGDFPAASHERALDKLTMIAQQTKRLADRALKVPETQNNPNDLPNAGTGNRLLGSNNGTLGWEENRNPPPYPSTAGTQALVTAGSGSAPSWQTIPAIATGPITATGTTTPRFLSDRFAERLNVLDFGADPTGATDSRAAFIAAINAAPAWGTVYIPTGRYTGVCLLNINKPLAIVGDGPMSTILDTPDFERLPSGTRDSGIIELKNGCTHCIVRDMSIEWNGGFSSAKAYSDCINSRGINSNQFALEVVNVHFKNFTESVSIWRSGHVCKYLLVENCKFHYVHGFASCRYALADTSKMNWMTQEIGVYGWTIGGTAKITILRNNEFDGLLDPTFTNVDPDAPEWLKHPPDNFFQGGGALYETLVIENNTIRNFGVEGIVFLRWPHQGSYDNRADNFNRGNAIIRGNTFIGPRLVGSYSRGVTPAIAVYDTHRLSVCDNYIADCTEGVKVERDADYVSCASGSSVFTFHYRDYAGFNAQDARPIIANGKKLRFFSKLGANINDSNTVATNLELDKEYYIINAGSITNKTVQFGLSNTANGSAITLQGSSLAQGYVVSEAQFNELQLAVTNNVIVGCLVGVSVTRYPQHAVTIANNYIEVSGTQNRIASGWYNTADQTDVPPRNCCALRPIQVNTGGVLATNNVIRIGDEPWDGVYDLVSRDQTGTVFTLGSGQVADIASKVKVATLPFANTPTTIYGSFTVWRSDLGAFHFPIESINVQNNTVTCSPGWTTGGGADQYTGKLYWVYTPNLAINPALWLAFTGFARSRFYGNTIINAMTEYYIESGRATLVAGNNTFLQMRGRMPGYDYLQSDILREENFDLISMLQGAGAPTMVARNGSFYLRTDGDSSNTCYVRANNEWKPLASWNP